MSIIDTQNARQIRDPMEVHAAINYNLAEADVNLAYTITGDVKAMDTDTSGTLQKDAWPMRELADFADGGFILDGRAELLDTSVTPSESTGKIGIRTTVGGTCTIKAFRSDTEFPAVTVVVTSGTGTITANSVSYDVSSFVVIPVNSTSVTMTVKADAGTRIEIAGVMPGVQMTFDNSNLISVVASLRSDTSIEGASWEVSEIEIQAYWPDDISDAIGNLGDDTPITYWAGYGTDTSRVRKFYLSEKASQQDGVITLKGDDASAKLENYTMTSRLLNVPNNNSRAVLYDNLIRLILSRAGIKLDYNEANRYKIEKYGSIAGECSIQLSEQSGQTYISELTNIIRYHTSTVEFWPVFVDAGYPALSWRYPRQTLCNRGYGYWTIFEEDCGDVVESVDRNIAAIETSSDSYGLNITAARSKKWIRLRDYKAKKGKTYNFRDTEHFYYQFKVTNFTEKRISEDGHGISWKARTTTKVYKRYRRKGTKHRYKTRRQYKRLSSKAKKRYKLVTIYKNRSKLYGRRVSLTPAKKGKDDSVFYGYQKIVHDLHRPGTTMQVDPIAYGKVMMNGSIYLYPNYATLFRRSNKTGQFTWRGDPRMQPHDYFYFVPKEISKETWASMNASARSNYLCTIEDITITHEGGGTSAEITYRKGIC